MPYKNMSVHPKVIIPGKIQNGLEDVNQPYFSTDINLVKIGENSRLYEKGVLCTMHGKGDTFKVLVRDDMEKTYENSEEKNIIVLSGSNILNSIAFLEDPIFNDSSKLKVFDKFVYENGSDIGVDDTANESNIIRYL